MIAEQGSINNLLYEASAVDVLVEGLSHKAIQVKRNCSDTLAFILKDNEIREQIEDERILHTLLHEYKNVDDQVHTENILLCLMHLSYHKKFKPPLYEANIVDMLLHNISNNKTEEEALFSTRILINISYNSDVKAKIYDKVAVPISQLMYSKPAQIVVQLLQLIKKLTEGEKSDPEIDARMVDCIIQASKHNEREIFELGFLVMKILCDNNPDILLQDFETKGGGIKITINFFLFPDLKVQEIAVAVIILYLKHGYITEVNFHGKTDLLAQAMVNFNSDSDTLRYLSIQMISYMVNDIQIHEMVNNSTNFNFLLGDIQSVLEYETLYPQEQNLLMHTMKIFGEMSKTQRTVELNMTNGLLPMTLAILEQETKFSKEVRIWCIIIIN